MKWTRKRAAEFLAEARPFSPHESKPVVVNGPGHPVLTAEDSTATYPQLNAEEMTELLAFVLADYVSAFAGDP